MINILSQDRLKLVDGTNLEIIEREEFGYAIYSNEINDDIAIYETEERAKEILADIYAKISEGKITYKMPKE